MRGAYGLVKENLNLSRYNKIMIDPIVMHFSEATSQESLSSSEVDLLKMRFHDLLTHELNKSFIPVNQAGADVLRLRTAVTNLFSNQDLGINSNPDFGRRATFSKPGETPDLYINVSGAAIEMELLDSASGERLAALVDRKGQQVSSAKQKWQVVDAAFTYWATRIGDILAKLE